MVAAMVEALEVQASDRVLEVGTGTGYEAAVLGELAAEVWTIERHAELADRARQILAELGYGNVHVVCGDGSLGLPEQAPFDKILVAAGAPQAPPSLVAQLAEGGMMAVPVGNRVEQQLQVVRRDRRRDGYLIATCCAASCRWWEPKAGNRNALSAEATPWTRVTMPAAAKTIPSIQ